MRHAISDWHAANQRYLTARLEVLAQSLLRQGDADPAVQRELEAAEASLPEPAALDRLQEIFGLSLFERDLVLLIAGMDLDSGFAERCAEAGISRSGGVTFSFAFSRLPDPHWSALAPNGPLRRWRLIESADGSEISTRSPLRIDERVLHHLLGISYLDTRLEGFMRQVEAGGELPPSQREITARVRAMLDSEEPPIPLVHLFGSDRAAGKAIAAAACASLGLDLYSLRGADIPASVNERTALSRLWEREAALESAALLVEVAEGENESAAESFLDATRGMILVTGQRPLRVDRRTLRCDYAPPSYAERVSAWSGALGPVADRMNGSIGRIACQFRLGSDALRDVASEALRLAPVLTETELEQRLWQGCRSRSRRGLDRLAQRIEPHADWNQIVLPPEQIDALHSITRHVRQQAKVYEEWGFARRGARGLGVSALFAGPSGTGKTMAAEVIAQELALDLYRIDLSQVVNKYIGETEKNLRAVFDAAEEGGAVLLFDEADALFGKRSEVKDSHDRYANIEVSYLLQRMEDYRGLAILTTNQKDALDKAFLRRIRFVVQFPFPDLDQRAEIWRRIFPAETPTEGIDPRRLARLNVAGGNIRNIAMCAAFIAADKNEPVRMRHVLEAARAEYGKMERPLTQTEMGGLL